MENKPQSHAEFVEAICKLYADVINGYYRTGNYKNSNPKQELEAMIARHVEAHTAPEPILETPGNLEPTTDPSIWSNRAYSAMQVYKTGWNMDAMQTLFYHAMKSAAEDADEMRNFIRFIQTKTAFVLTHPYPDDKMIVTLLQDLNTQSGNITKWGSAEITPQVVSRTAEEVATAVCDKLRVTYVDGPELAATIIQQALEAQHAKTWAMAIEAASLKSVTDEHQDLVRALPCPPLEQEGV